MIDKYIEYIKESDELDKDFFKHIKGWNIDIWILDKVYHYKKKLKDDIKDYFLNKIVKYKGGKTIKVTGFYELPGRETIMFKDSNGNFHKIEHIIGVKDENELDFIEFSKNSDIDPYGEEEWE